MYCFWCHYHAKRAWNCWNLFEMIQLLWSRFTVFEVTAFYWTLDVSRTASHKINFIRLAAHPSLSFLMIWSLVFPDIVHDESWPKADFSKQKFCSRVGPETRFLPVSQVWFITLPWNCMQWQLAIMSIIS